MEHRGEREGHAGRDWGREDAMFKDLILKGKGASLKEGTDETTTDTINRIGSGD